MKGTKKILILAVAVIFSLLLVFVPDYNEKVQDGSHKLKTMAADTLRCGILARDSLTTKGHRLGLLYELFRKFEKDNSCHITVELFSEEIEVVNSLISGKKDMAIVQYELDIDNVPYLFSSISLIEQDYKLVCRAEDYNYLAGFGRWFRSFRNTHEYEKLMYRFRINKSSSSISPYDEMIKKAARKVDWDWRLLAALIYKESHFKIGLSSSKGAIGLMQIKRNIADKYGISDIYDPQQNLHAGTMYLKELQTRFSNMGCDSLNCILFAIASYNCGFTRIEDGMEIARQEGQDFCQWEQVRTILPSMAQSSFCQSYENVKTINFRGQETVDYVNDVLDLYDNYKSRFE